MIHNENQYSEIKQIHGSMHKYCVFVFLIDDVKCKIEMEIENHWNDDIRIN